MDYARRDNCFLQIQYNGKVFQYFASSKRHKARRSYLPLTLCAHHGVLDKTNGKNAMDPNFNHHAKCEKIKLTNLTFADNILLFCRGDVIFVQMMLQTMDKFSSSTWMVMNPHKCKIYMGGMSVEDTVVLKQAFGFQDGEFPFRYLGVPLTTKKLNINHYLPLINKIVARVHHWSAKMLSYAGRVQLVKSISHAMAQFWMQCFPIPKMVIKKIDSICHSFIWTRK